MRIILGLAFSAALCLLALSPARAEPLNAKSVSADAKWVLHIDVDAMRDTAAWGILRLQLEKDPGFGQGVDDIESFTGMRFPQDLHDVTLYGTGYDEQSAVVMISATVDQGKVMGLLQMNPSYATHKHREHQVMTWEDKGKNLFGCFHEKRIIISQNRDMVQSALDTLDAKANAVKADADLLGGLKPGSLMYVSGSGLDKLPQQANSPLAGQLDKGWVSFSEKDETLLLNAAITATSSQTAEQMRASLDGIKAMVGLAAMNKEADPNAKLAAQLLRGVTATVQDKTVSVVGKAPIEAIRTMLENAKKQQEAGQ